MTKFRQGRDSTHFWYPVSIKSLTSKYYYICVFYIIANPMVSFHVSLCFTTQTFHFLCPCVSQSTSLNSCPCVSQSTSLVSLCFTIQAFRFTPIHYFAGGGPREPDFGGPINNVTVALGREAKLSCIVDNLLPSYKVSVPSYKVSPPSYK